MKIRNKLLLSLLAGLLAASMHTAPAWWGVLFRPVTEQLATHSITETADMPQLRLKSLDLLRSLLGR